MKTTFHIGIASDHAGFELKEKVKSFLSLKGYTVTDFGTHSGESVDYPDYAHLLGKSVNEENLPIGIAICGSGEGVCMTVNKYPNVRAALVWNKEVTALSRQHNNANILCLPARFLSESEAIECVQVFLDTDFEGGRHEKRVNKISV
ncbi:MAG: ribose 5-phosphate isomerase B [Bacteroidia bacterium]|nr:ribose 5-phosphate isomerase B [Bacteroidia bacterium]